MTEEPLYNIGVVTRLTGISIPTLHAWERRHGFPTTDRTEGGHRLYSDQDIARLRWVKSKMNSGMAVSSAIRALRSLEESGNPFLDESSRSVEPIPNTIPSDLHSVFLDSLLQHDLLATDRIMGELLAFHSPEDLCINVIGPALAHIGDAWEKGMITVATEHLASNYLRHRLLMWMVTGPAPRTLNPVLLACAPGEWHEGSLLMIGVLLRRRGWSVAYLGQNVPFQGMADFVAKIHPSIILLVAMQEQAARNLVEWQQWIPQESGKPAVVFGGRAFIVDPGLKLEIPGLYLGDTIHEGVVTLESLLQTTITPGTPTQTPR